MQLSDVSMRACDETQGKRIPCVHREETTSDNFSTGPDEHLNLGPVKGTWANAHLAEFDVSTRYES